VGVNVKGQRKTVAERGSQEGLKTPYIINIE